MEYSQIKQGMENIVDLFTSKMTEFQSELNTVKSKNSTVASLNLEFQNFKTFVCNALNMIKSQLEMLHVVQDRLEMRSRRKMLLVHGVPETKNEKITVVVSELISKKFGIADFVPSSLKTCHRMGRTSAAVAKPRPILVKFKNLHDRDQVWYGKKALKGTKITLSEFLTKMRHDAFMAAREAYGVTKCWSRDGWIHILTPDGTRHKVESLSDLSKLSALMGEPTVPAAPKQTADM